MIKNTKLITKFEELLAKLKANYVNDIDENFRVTLNLLGEVLSNLRDQKKSHPDLLAYVRQLLGAFLKGRNDVLLENFNNYFDSARIFISDQYLNRESQQTNAVGVLLFIDSNDEQPYTILFEYQGEITTLGVRVINQDAFEKKESIFEVALKRRLEDLGFSKEDVISVAKIDRNKYGYQEESSNYHTTHHIVIIRSQPKEEIQNKISAVDNQLAWLKPFTSNFFIISLQLFVKETQLSHFKNKEGSISQEIRIRAVFSNKKVRTSSILMLRLALQNQLYRRTIKDLPKDPNALTSDQVAKICEDGKHFVSSKEAAISSWYQSNVNGDYLSQEPAITLFKFLDATTLNLPQLNPALIKELVFRLFELEQPESEWFHENLGHWFTTKSRLALQTVTAFFLIYNSASNHLTREECQSIIQTINNEVKKELKDRKIIEQFFEQYQNPNNYEFLKNYVASLLQPDEQLINDPPKGNRFTDHLMCELEAYKKILTRFNRSRYESLEHFGFYFYAPTNFLTVVTNIVWARILTETFQKFISPLVESQVKKIFANNVILHMVDWQT